MKSYTFDFYNAANLKAYNLNDTMRYQLAILDKTLVWASIFSASALYATLEK